MPNGCQIQNKRTKLALGAQKSEKWHCVIKGHWPLMTSVDPGLVTIVTMSGNSHYVSVSHGCHLVTPIHVQFHITNKNTEVRKFQVLKRYGTQISLDMTLEIRSQVKGHSRHELKIFREDVKLFKGYASYAKFCDDRPIRISVYPIRVYPCM